MNENQQDSMYGGYVSDEVKSNSFLFGLNAGNTFLTKFEFIPNGGKDGAEQEAIDIVFNINGTDKSYRLFPIVKAFGKDNQEITDPNAPEFKDAVTNLKAIVTHILHCFIDSEDIKAALSVPFKGFKHYATTAASLLPKDFAKKPLDIFLQYQWTIPQGKDRAYLEIPTKMKQGRWLTAAQPGTWIEVRKQNAADNDSQALKYGKAETATKDERGTIISFTEYHPIMKNGWFLNSNYANQQKDTSGTSQSYNSGNAEASAAMNAGTTSPVVQPPSPDSW